MVLFRYYLTFKWSKILGVTDGRYYLDTTELGIKVHPDSREEGTLSNFLYFSMITREDFLFTIAIINTLTSVIYR